MFGSEGRENKRLEIISFENVSKAFEPGNPVLCDISVSIERGEFVFITGASGAGKSTLIRLLLRDVIPDTGRDIMRLLERINETGTTVIVVTHDAD